MGDKIARGVRDLALIAGFVVVWFEPGAGILLLLLGGAFLYRGWRLDRDARHQELLDAMNSVGER